jgi:hypothetical protein
MTDEQTPTECASEIEASRGRLLAFATQCTDADWHAVPIEGDPRCVGVILDHVAHAYEYLTGWIGELVAGQAVEVDSDVVDKLNAEHSADVGTVTHDSVAIHLRSSGDTLIALVSGLEPAQLELGDGQVRRFAMIAARHADGHRTEIEAALQAAV